MATRDGAWLGMCWPIGTTQNRRPGTLVSLIGAFATRGLQMRALQHPGHIEVTDWPGSVAFSQTATATDQVARSGTVVAGRQRQWAAAGHSATAFLPGLLQSIAELLVIAGNDQLVVEPGEIADQFSPQLAL